MKKRLLLSGLVLLALIAISPMALAADLPPDTRPADVSVSIDGKPAEFQVPIFIQNGATYVSIREFSTAMGAESVTWNDGAVTVSAPNLSMSAKVGDIYLVANGRYLFVPDTVQLVNGRVMVPVRVLCKAFNALIIWDESAMAVRVVRGSGAIETAGAYYDETDLYWMSRIINAEACGEPLTGKIAVGGVIMNRLKDPEFPKTVYDVIFDNQFGVQFTPTENGSIYNTPSEECVIAAKIALDGGNTAGSSLYFAATTHCWAGRNRPMAMSIGNHFFYA